MHFSVVLFGTEIKYKHKMSNVASGIEGYFISETMTLLILLYSKTASFPLKWGHICREYMCDKHHILVEHVGGASDG